MLCPLIHLPFLILSHTSLHNPSRIHPYTMPLTIPCTPTLTPPTLTALHAAVGEEPAGLLGLLVPCMNAKTDTGENREKTVLNPEYLAAGGDRLALYAQFGKLLGLACRHDIMVPLALPDLVWQPLAGESVAVPALQATDAHTARSVLTIMQRSSASSRAQKQQQTATGSDQKINDTTDEVSLHEDDEGTESSMAATMSEEQAEELLTQALLATIQPSTGVGAGLGPSAPAAAAAVKAFITASDGRGDGDGADSGRGGGGDSGGGDASADAIDASQEQGVGPVAGTLSPSAQQPLRTGDRARARAGDRMSAVCELILQSHLTAHKDGLAQVRRSRTSYILLLTSYILRSSSCRSCCCFPITYRYALSHTLTHSYTCTLSHILSTPSHSPSHPPPPLTLPPPPPTAAVQGLSRCPSRRIIRHVHR